MPSIVIPLFPVGVAGDDAITYYYVPYGHGETALPKLVYRNFGDFRVRSLFGSLGNGNKIDSVAFIGHWRDSIGAVTYGLFSFIINVSLKEKKKKTST